MTLNPLHHSRSCGPAFHWPWVHCCLGLFSNIRKTGFTTLGNGLTTADAMLNSVAIIGYGGVVVQTAGFQQLAILYSTQACRPHTSRLDQRVCAITGSASGGLQIFMQTMAQDLLLWLDPGRSSVATAAGGFDSLPHCGAVITMLTIHS